MKRVSAKRIILIATLALLIAGLLIPQHFTNPVKGADKNSYNPKSFWHHPWGRSVTHKGVDIFARQGTTVHSSTGGVVVFASEVKVGGNVVLVLGPKWRLHYYAHLHDIKTCLFEWTNSNEVIGTVGATGNAKGKSPHLHYSIITLIPYPWRVDRTKQGWKKKCFI